MHFFLSYSILNPFLLQWPVATCRIYIHAYNSSFYWILLQLKQTSRWSFKGLKLDEEKKDAKKEFLLLFAVLFVIVSFQFHSSPQIFILPKDINPFKLILLTPGQSFSYSACHLILICFVFYFFFAVPSFRTLYFLICRSCL